jgi:predicted outer membrane repeat protein
MKAKLSAIVLILTVLFVVTSTSYGCYNPPPVVYITEPADGATFIEGEDITIKANASDSDGISEVRFYKDGTVELGSASTEPYSCVWNNVPVGSYELTAKAWDSKGASTLSDPVNVFVGVIRYVDIDAEGNNDGTSWEDAYEYLQDALDAAQPGDQIWVAEGTYYPDQNSTNPDGSGLREATFQLKVGVGIYGGFASGETSLDQRNWVANETILSGDINQSNDPIDNSYHVVTGADNATIDGFTITNGNANGSYWPAIYGGGMYCDGTSPTINNCTFSGNSAKDNGGGLYCAWFGSPNITNCTFSENSAHFGGGLYVCVYNSPFIANCVFKNNYVSGDGGGACVDSANPGVSFTNCVFSENSAPEYGYGGGGLRIGFSSVIITNCVFNRNESFRGSGIESMESDVEIVNCTFFDNVGGAICNYCSNPIITNCILWGTADHEIYNYACSSNPVVTYCDIRGGYEGQGNIDRDPSFADTSNPAGVDGIFGTFDDGLQLKNDSPCLDAADGDKAPETDIANHYRVDDEDVDNTGTGNPPYADIGAYESYTKVYLMAGQSNMAGVSPIPTGGLTGELNETRKDIPIYWRNPSGDMVWTHLQPGLGEDPCKFGPEITFCRGIVDAQLGENIVFVKYGLGGTSLWYDWNPDCPINGYRGDGLFCDFKDAVNNVLGSVGNPHIAGMIWMQGEHDAWYTSSTMYAPSSSQERARDYDDNLTNFIQRVRAYFGEPDLPFVIGQIADSPTWKWEDDVQQRQLYVSKTVDNTALVVTIDLYLHDNMHYTTEGMITLGKRFANAMHALTGGTLLYPMSSCVGHWEMNDNAANKTVIDSSGNENHGIAFQNTSVLHNDSGDPPYLNGALTFNGSDDFITTGMNNFPSGAAPRSASFWIQWNGSSKYNVIFGYGIDTDTPANKLFGTFLNSSGNLYCWINYVNTSENYDTGIDITIGIWTHIVLTYDGTYIRAYKDGTLVNTTAKVLDTVPDASAIGRNNWNGSHNFNGLIDNVMIFSSALTLDEIQLLYNLGFGREYGYILSKPSSVGHWKMDDNESSKTVLDSSGNDNHGTAVHNTSFLHTYSGGKPYLHGALAFNGSSDFITTGTNNFPSGAAARSASLWIKWNGSTTNNVIFGYGDDATGYKLFGAFLDPSGNLRCWINYLSNSENYDTGIDITVGTWTHIVLTYDGTDIRAYKNSVLSDERAKVLDTALDKSAIGRNDWTTDDNFYGSVDNLIIFNKALSQDEINLLYNKNRDGTEDMIEELSDLSGFVVGHWKMNDNNSNKNKKVDDSSIYNNYGTAFRPTSVMHTYSGDLPYLNGALIFNNIGDGNYVEIDDVVGIGAYTKVAWIKSNSNDYVGNIVSSNSTSHAFFVEHYGGIDFQLAAGHNLHWPQVWDKDKLAPNTWYFVAVTFDPAVDSGTMVLYKDGSEVARSPSVDTQAECEWTYIGGFFYQGKTYHWRGSIDNVMIFNRALTPNEIMLLYNMQLW